MCVGMRACLLCAWARAAPAALTLREPRKWPVLTQESGHPSTCSSCSATSRDQLSECCQRAHGQNAAPASSFDPWTITRRPGADARRTGAAPHLVPPTQTWIRDCKQASLAHHTVPSAHTLKQASLVMKGRGLGLRVECRGRGVREPGLVVLAHGSESPGLLRLAGSVPQALWPQDRCPCLPPPY